MSEEIRIPPMPPKGSPEWEAEMRRVRVIRDREREKIRRNAESERPTLYYSPPLPPASADTDRTGQGEVSRLLEEKPVGLSRTNWSPIDAADRIVEYGFEEMDEDQYGGIMLWAFPPNENDGVQGEVLVKVVLPLRRRVRAEGSSIPWHHGRSREKLAVRVRADV